MIPAYLSLANHLWQSSLFAGVAGLLTLALRKNRASIRYWLWLAASMKFLIPFSLLVSIGSQFEWRTAPTIAQHQFSVVDQVAQPFASAVPPPLLRDVPPVPSRVPTVLFCVWFCGFAIAAFLWFRGWRRIRAAVRAASPLSQDLPIAPLPIQGMCSQVLMEPTVFGILRPVLLLPQGIMDRLTPDQLKAILIHELSHVRRRDNLSAALHMLVETLFWFYPLVWWMGKQLRDEREHACDEEVLRVIDQPEDYAEGILNVCKFCLESPLSCASGVTGSNLRTRIEAIMTNRIAEKLSFRRKLLIVIAATIALSVPLIVGLLNAPVTQAQSQVRAQQSFEVASIKPWKLTDDNSRQAQLIANGFDPFDGLMNPNGRFTATAVTLKKLISWAYGVPVERILAGPDWTGAERYVIEAKAADGAMLPGEVSVRYEQLHFMLQALLENQFALKIHREAKELPVYALVVAKNGPKLHKADRDCSSPSAGISPDSLCHGFTGGGPRTGLTGQSITMTELAGFLSGPGSSGLDRPVVDKTGIPGAFDLKIRPWNYYIQGVPEGTTQTDGGREGGVTDLNSLPTMFTLLEEQFGLKLEATKAPLETIVIDGAQRPSEN
jgi:bla regulator protein BlaR1